VTDTRKRFRWIYWPSLVHLAICLIALLGYVARESAVSGDTWSLLTIFDIPVSMVTIALAFSQTRCARWGMGNRRWDAMVVLDMLDG